MICPFMEIILFHYLLLKEFISSRKLLTLAFVLLCSQSTLKWQKDREQETEREMERETEIEMERDTERERERERERDGERQRQRERERDG